MFTNNFWALVPPIVAIVLALITKEAYSSLFIGVVIGALFFTNFAPAATVTTIVNDGMIPAVAENAGIFIFLVILGIIVAIINRSGGSAAFGRWAKKNIRTKAGASIATFILGILIFIDDYFNCLTVGSVMRPVTDSKKISRQKLAYLIDATAAPVCMIAPISSWAAAVSSTADDLSVINPELELSGIDLFIKAIPYNFYSILTFVFIIVVIVTRSDFGAMVKFERNAENGDLGGLPTSEAEEQANPRGRFIDLLLPVLVLIIGCIIGMILDGGYFSADSEYYHDLIGAFGNTTAANGLPWGGIITLVFTIIYVMCRRILTFKDAMDCVKHGFFNMVPPILILTLAVSLKNMTSMLGAAEYIRMLMDGASMYLYSLLPAVIFLVACGLAFATGTSWGTFGILIPIVTAIFSGDMSLLFIGISACCAGAVCGDHCSPISDTTIMASAGAQCDHVTHVSTQLPYAIFVALVSFICFILVGFTRNLFVGYSIGIAIIVGHQFLIKYRKKPAKA